jgi:3-carboxy-cis,cis-muconate cycloisomerase
MSESSDSGNWSARLFGDAAMNALFTDRARLQGMLDFEAALARAEARCGVVPQAAVDVIAKHCDAQVFDLNAIGDAARLAGNPAIPMVKLLTAAVKVDDAEAARWVHWGATSQDAIDTGLVLQLRDALALIDDGCAALIEALARLANEHRGTVMAGRTWLQQAVPITFGLKAAGWLDALLRERQRIAELRPRLLVLQFGGAAGTLASLGDRGLVIAQALSEELDLWLPATPWHTARDRIAEAGSVVGLLAGTFGKIARDLSLLMQTEIAEAFEPAAEGKGGSSTMPHKRNPVGCSVVLANALRVPGLVATLFSAMTQEHERGLGNWPAEWETLPEIFRLTAGSLAALTPTLAGLEIDAARMRENLDATRGLLFAERVTMALAEKMGKQAAHHRLETLSRRVVAERRHLRELLNEDTQLSLLLPAKQLDALFDPAGALGVAGSFIDRVLAAAAQIN